MQKKSGNQNKWRFVFSFAFILILWISVAAFMDIKAKYLLDKVVLRYFIYFAWLFIVAISGQFVWMKDQAKWIKLFWQILYIIAGTVLLLSGVIDIFIFALSTSVKSYIQAFRLFFLSPVPLGLLYLFSRLSERTSSP